METLSSILTSLGLSSNEKDVYISLLQGGRQSTTTLARRLNKPRTTLYTYIDSLLDQGMIQVEQTPRGQRFNALAIDNLLDSISQKKHVYDQSLTELEAIRDTYESLRNTMTTLPKIKVYETKEARNLVYKKLQNFSQASSIFNYDAAIEFLHWNQQKKAQAGTIPPHATVREILIDSPQARDYQHQRQTTNQGRHQIRLLDSSQLGAIQSDILLIDGIYYHTSLGEHIMMIEINDPLYYQSQQALFDYIWNSLADST